MSDDSTINFSKAEKYSYVYADEKFSKLAVAATGEAKLVDPLAWSYAETHSYVKVDPSSVGVEVPSGVTELYAKVIYTAGSGSSSGGSTSGYHTHQMSDVIGLSGKINSLSAAITANSNDVATLSAELEGIIIPTKLSDLTNDQDFVTVDAVSGMISGIDVPSVPSALSEFDNDLGFATSSYVDEVVNGIDIPSQVSELENDSQYMPLSAVQEMMQNITNSFNLRLAKLEAASPSGETNLGDREDEIQMFNFGDRLNSPDMIIEYSDRVTD